MVISAKAAVGMNAVSSNYIDLPYYPELEFKRGPTGGQARTL